VGDATRPPDVSILDGTIAVGDAHGDIQPTAIRCSACPGATVLRRGLAGEITAGIRRWIRCDIGLWL
jgi:hypothetical protein